MKMSNTERNIYDTYIMDSMKGRDYLVSAEEKGERKGREEGIQIGKAEGEAKRNLEIARTLLAKGLDVKFVAETTGLSMQDLAKIQQD